MNNVLKRSILLLLTLIIPMTATNASADFLSLNLSDIRHLTEVIQIALLGTGLFIFASFLRSEKKQESE